MSSFHPRDTAHRTQAMAAAGVSEVGGDAAVQQAGAVAGGVVGIGLDRDAAAVAQNRQAAQVVVVVTGQGGALQAVLEFGQLTGGVVAVVQRQGAAAAVDPANRGRTEAQLWVSSSPHLSSKSDLADKCHQLAALPFTSFIAVVFLYSPIKKTSPTKANIRCSLQNLTTYCDHSASRLMDRRRYARTASGPMAAPER